MKNSCVRSIVTYLTLCGAQSKKSIGTIFHQGVCPLARARVRVQGSVYTVAMTAPVSPPTDGVYLGEQRLQQPLGAPATGQPLQDQSQEANT